MKFGNNDVKIVSDVKAEGTRPKRRSVIALKLKI